MELHVTKRKGREIVVLLDNDMRIVKPVYDYLKYQDQRDRAINTLIAYGNDLKAFWEFLSDYGYAYDEVSPKMIGEYKEYLMSEDDNIIAINKEGARTAKTINRMLSTLHGFYQYQADMQEIDNPLLMHEVNRPFNAFKGILEHARSDNKTKQSIFKDEIDDVITDLAKTMSFNPLPTGVCLYDFRRGNCTDGDGCFFYNCPNYITEVQFYPILKDELDLLEKEMARLKELDHEREWQKQYIKYKYLKPLVESLEVQLNGKESVG